MGFFILAEIGYRSAQVFYNGLLPEIANQEEMGRVSGYGWAIGTVGGIVCLLLILALILLLGGKPAGWNTLWMQLLRIHKRPRKLLCPRIVEVTSRVHWAGHGITGT